MLWAEDQAGLHRVPSQPVLWAERKKNSRIEGCNNTRWWKLCASSLCLGISHYSCLFGHRKYFMGSHCHIQTTNCSTIIEQNANNLDLIIGNKDAWSDNNNKANNVTAYHWDSIICKTCCKISDPQLFWHS